MPVLHDLDTQHTVEAVQFPCAEDTFELANAAAVEDMLLAAPRLHMQAFGYHMKFHMTDSATAVVLFDLVGMLIVVAEADRSSMRWVVHAVACSLLRTVCCQVDHKDQVTLAWDFVLSEGRICLLYTSPSPRDGLLSRMPSSA